MVSAQIPRTFVFHSINKRIVMGKHLMRVDELLVAKAVALGYQISKGKVFEQAIDLIERAIGSRSANSINPEVKAFYLMVMAEAFRFRQSNKHLENRSKSQNSARLRGFQIYLIFTRTLLRRARLIIRRAGGALSSVDKQRATFGTDISIDVGDSQQVSLPDNDDIIKILEWMGYERGRGISKADQNFLFNTNLSDLIKKHFGSVS